MGEAALVTEQASAAVEPDDLARAFEAQATSSATDRWIRLAGRVIRLRFGSDRMTHLVEAFEHLVCPPASQAALTIHVWDAPEGQRLPLPAVPEDAVRGLRMMWTDGAVRGCYQPGQDTLSVLDHSAGQAWFWCLDGRALPYWEHAAPFRLILSWWLGAQGANLVHGAAVGRADGGALVVGKGGSGKSTTALLSLLAGLSYASDDYVVVEGDHLAGEAGEPGEARGPVVHSAFGSGKLDNAQCLRFPSLQPAIVNPVREAEEKAVFLVNRFAPQRMIDSFPLRAVLVPRITGLPDTRVRPGSAVAALAALAPSTIFQLPGSPGNELRAMADVIRAVPTYSLELGTEFEQIPRCIDDLLAALSGRAKGTLP